MVTEYTYRVQSPRLSIQYNPLWTMGAVDWQRTKTIKQTLKQIDQRDRKYKFNLPIPAMFSRETRGRKWFSVEDYITHDSSNVLKQ